MNVNIQGNYTAGVVLALGGTLFFSTKAIFIKKAYQYGIDSVTLLFLRMSMALPFYVLVYMLNKKSEKALSLREIVLVCLTGCVGYYLASYLDLTGLLYISASFERMILYLFPTFVLLISVVLFKHKIKVNEIVAFAVCYLGILVIYSQELSAAGNAATVGVLLVFGSAIAFSIFVVASGQLVVRVGSQRFTSLSMIAAALATCVHFSFDGNASAYGYENEVYGLAFILAIFCTVLPSYLINMGIKRIGAANSAIIGTISPVFTIVLAYVFLQETSSMIHILGFILVISGIAMITIRKKQTA
ncbi:DMT family transporter [Kaarinaea lacus]